MKRIVFGDKYNCTPLLGVLFVCEKVYLYQYYQDPSEFKLFWTLFFMVVSQLCAGRVFTSTFTRHFVIILGIGCGSYAHPYGIRRDRSDRCFVFESIPHSDNHDISNE